MRGIGVETLYGIGTDVEHFVCESCRQPGHILNGHIVEHMEEDTEKHKYHCMDCGGALTCDVCCGKLPYEQPEDPGPYACDACGMPDENAYTNSFLEWER
jgi:hypothetical protein